MPKIEAIEAIKTIEPFFRANIAGAAARVRAKDPRTCVFSTLRNSASVVSSAGFLIWLPALFTRMVGGAIRSRRDAFNKFGGGRLIGDVMHHIMAIGSDFGDSLLQRFFPSPRDKNHCPSLHHAFGRGQPQSRVLRR